MRCAVCDAGAARPYRSVDGVAYYRCGACGSLFAHPDFLARVEAGGASGYAEEYWRNELGAARERCFGPAVLRVAETIAYCRVPIRGFVDIGAGTGWLLDALEVLLPEVIDRFHAVELYPPPLPHRTANPNYIVGTLGDAHRTFDAGVCIEVIEHLTPATLRARSTACGGVAAWIAVSVQLRAAGLRGTRGSRLPRSARARARRVLLDGRRRNDLRACRIQGHRTARPGLGIPCRVRIAVAG
jgi:hypothetical protein